MQYDAEKPFRYFSSSAILGQHPASPGSGGSSMKFTCDKSGFAREISFAQEIIASRNALSIMSNVYLEVSGSSLTLRATDVKVAFETTIPVSDAISGSVTVFCDKLSGILASLPDGEITVEQTEGRVTLKPSNKKVRFQLKTISGEKFPELPRAPEESYFEVPARELRKMVTQTMFAVSTDETRYFMNGVFMEKAPDGGVIMVATDGRRLSFAKKEFEGNIPDFRGVIVPPKALGILVKRSGDEGMVSMAVTDRNVFFRFGSYSISSVLIEGQFPNYQKVIPQNQRQSFTVLKSDLSDALRRVSIFVEQKSNRTFFGLSDGTLTLSSEESEIGTAREELPCRYEGEDLTIALNYKYVEEPLKAMDSESVTVEFSEAARAITIKPEPAQDYFHVVMPMQLD